jgi:aquaporin SIP
MVFCQLISLKCHVQAFGWAYVNDRHNTWEQLYVYWIGPFIGAILAAWTFKAVFLPPSPKPKAKKA